MDEKIKAVFEKEGFTDKLYECETLEEAQKLFASEGIALSLEETKSVGDLLEKELNGEEISDDELNSVTGGIRIPHKYRSKIKRTLRRISDSW